MAKPSLEALTAAHTQRLRQLDAALPEPRPLISDAETTVITASVAKSHAAGLSRTSVVDIDDFASTFRALRQHSLEVQLHGPRPAVALGALLNTWRDTLADEDPTELETAATITWPSRDTAAVSALVKHGFTAVGSLALRRRMVPVQLDADPPVDVRDAEPGDLDSVVALNMDELRYDAQFGGCTIRAGTEQALRTRTEAALARRDGTLMVAQRRGKPVGLIVVDLPPRTQGVTELVNASRAGYVRCLSVRADARGQGIGRALVHAAFERFRDAAIETTLLHHVLVNPRSTPFWYMLGYRPLWTIWTALPHPPMFHNPPAR